MGHNHLILRNFLVSFLTISAHIPYRRAGNLAPSGLGIRWNVDRGRYRRGKRLRCSLRHHRMRHLAAPSRNARSQSAGAGQGAARVAMAPFRNRRNPDSGGGAIWPLGTGAGRGARVRASRIPAFGHGAHFWRHGAPCAPREPEPGRGVESIRNEMTTRAPATIVPARARTIARPERSHASHVP